MSVNQKKNHRTEPSVTSDWQFFLTVCSKKGSDIINTVKKKEMVYKHMFLKHHTVRGVL